MATRRASSATKCGAAIRTIPVADVEAVIVGMAQTDVFCSAVCTHCGAVNMFSGCLQSKRSFAPSVVGALW